MLHIQFEIHSASKELFQHSRVVGSSGVNGPLMVIPQHHFRYDVWALTEPLQKAHFVSFKPFCSAASPSFHWASACRQSPWHYPVGYLAKLGIHFPLHNDTLLSPRGSVSQITMSRPPLFTLGMMFSCWFMVIVANSAITTPLYCIVLPAFLA